MNDTTSIGTMFSNLPYLRRYATQAIIDERDLSEADERDKAIKLREFTATGASLNWTEKEMVVLILREVFARAYR